MKKSIYFRSTKHNNVDRKCVIFEEGMTTSPINTSFGVFTMQNCSTNYKPFNFNKEQYEEIIKLLKSSLRKDFGFYYSI